MEVNQRILKADADRAFRVGLAGVRRDPAGGPAERAALRCPRIAAGGRTR